MIQLHVDLAVDPKKEAEILKHFTTVFRPAAAKFAGYVDVRMLKLRTMLMGSAPASMTYRFSLTYQTEELRQKWLNSEIHANVWGPMEKSLSSPNYSVLLFDME